MNGKAQVNKKKYLKPELRVIRIAPGVETLGTGCKLEDDSVLGYNGNPCTSGVCAIAFGS